MDMQTIILVIFGILVVVGLYLYNRNRTQLPPTYYDPNNRSGGQQPTYDDPAYRSDGSIGGQQRTNDYDLPPSTSNDTLGGPLNNPANNPAPYRPQPRTQQQGQERPRHDSKDFKSGGSIGGKQ